MSDNTKIQSPEFEQVLCDNLNKRLDEILREYRPISCLNSAVFNGAVAGFLIKTGLRLTRVELSYRQLEVVVKKLMKEVK